jgi:hypothetical protein
MTIRETVIQKIITIVGDRKKSVFPQKDTLPRVKRVKQAAKMTAPIPILVLSIKN